MRVRVVHIQIEPSDEHDGPAITATYNTSAGQWTFTGGTVVYPRYLKLMTTITDYLKASDTPRGGR